ncbi:hypothetical protein XAB3213_3960018 [Xanthomonas citri pv. bilvae]|nr:hypothetical protein XAB3213_3960018 [Xanthomonas citri pv. bilvae]
MVGSVAVMFPDGDCLRRRAGRASAQRARFSSSQSGRRHLAFARGHAVSRSGPIRPAKARQHCQRPSLALHHSLCQRSGPSYA